MKLRREGCDWWAAEMDVLPYALVLDFVLSDSALQAWDNSGQQVGLSLLSAHAQKPACSCLFHDHAAETLLKGAQNGPCCFVH